MAQAALPARVGPALVRAFRYQRMLDVERYAGISEMAECERIERDISARCCA